MRRLYDLFRSDSGFSMVLALAVSFVVFSLGAVWVATTNTELDEVVYYDHRAQAQNAAEAGARWAMAALADDIVDPTWVGVAADNTTTALTTTGIRTALATYPYVAKGTDSGALGGTCDLEVHRASANGEQLGEWWARITPIDLDTRTYQIESWGWGPSTTARQSVNQKVAIQVRLIPDTSGFTQAIFAEANLSGVNRKEVYGDVYAGATADIANSTTILPNDGAYPGTGKFRVYGDLLIASGSNNTFQGRVDVQGVVRDNKSGSDYSDVWVRADEDAEPATSFSGQSYFERADVSGEARFSIDAHATPYTGTINGTVIEDVTGMADVPQIPLPTFVWNAADYPDYTVYTYTAVADFESWFASNKGALSGVHYIDDATTLSLDFNGSTLADDFMLVTEGSLSVTKMPSTPAATEPFQVVLVMADTTGRLTTSNQVVTVDDTLHLLLFSNGEFDAANQTTVFGSIYGVTDISANRVEVHFRPPKDSLVDGFDFPVLDTTSFTAQPIVWRSLQTDDPTPITDYCGVPGGAAAAVPPPGSTTTTTTVPAGSTTTTTVGSTTTTTVAPTTTTTTLPELVCTKWTGNGKKCLEWGTP